MWKRRPGAKRFVKMPRTVATARMLDGRTKPGRLYRYQVQACAPSGMCGPLSQVVSVRVARKSDRRQNAGRITYWKHPQAYGLLEQMPLDAAALPGTTPKRGKGKRPVSPSIRYVSTNPSVASVDMSGNVTAWQVGQASIRMIAHNGLERLAPVRVVNYAYPTRFDATSIGGVGDAIQDYWNAEGARISALTTAILEARVAKGATLALSDNGDLVGGDGLPAAIQAQAKELLEDYSLPATIKIAPDDPSVGYTLMDPETGGEARLVYYYYYYGAGVPAPHWDVIWVG
ncbi:Ig-like domain-containing protein [Nocardioides kongjuensis]|uniref:Fibronectin type-III domain-containing protein n=1 Tax=Nocardioides kongjuensis TaxID=349522 RepID=A0A852RXW6_9ACTN|nr:hypothetical protein [Nocardioides kongjuensis]